jgi:hypothetical protein
MKAEADPDRIGARLLHLIRPMPPQRRAVVGMTKELLLGARSQNLCVLQINQVVVTEYKELQVGLGHTESPPPLAPLVLFSFWKLV